MTSQAATRSARPARSGRSTAWVPFALIALVLLPAFFGSLRLVELAGGPQLMPAEPRFTSSPLPLVVHIASALGYAVLGVFQFSRTCGDAGPAGTERPDGCWSSSAWRSPCRRCG